jgi:transposase
MRQLRAQYCRLHVHEFPSYAPELNPDELVWAYTQHALARIPCTPSNCANVPA